MEKCKADSQPILCSPRMILDCLWFVVIVSWLRNRTFIHPLSYGMRVWSGRNDSDCGGGKREDAKKGWIVFSSCLLLPLPRACTYTYIYTSNKNMSSSRICSIALLPTTKPDLSQDDTFLFFATTFCSLFTPPLFSLVRSRSRLWNSYLHLLYHRSIWNPS